MENNDKHIFFDRDGVLNYDNGYTYLWRDDLIPEYIAPILQHYQKRYSMNYYVVTNQSGIGRNRYSVTDYKIFMGKFYEYFTSLDVVITDDQFCPHDPTDLDFVCNCRKPNNLMFENLIQKYQIPRSRAYCIGDKPSDLEAARKSFISKSFFFDNSLRMDEENSQLFVSIMDKIAND